MRRTLLLSLSLLPFMTAPSPAMAALVNYCNPHRQICLDKPCKTYGQRARDFDGKNVIVCKGATSFSATKKWQVYVPPPPPPPLESVTVFKPTAVAGTECNPRAGAACIGRLCTTIGESQLDADQKHVLVCLLNDHGQKVWKEMSTQGEATLTTYERNAEGISNLGAHQYCALGRYMHGAWGSATFQNCEITRLDNGTWTMYAHFQRNAEIMSPGYVTCKAICMD